MTMTRLSITLLIATLVALPCFTQARPADGAKPTRSFVVVIDAGHGGKDTGAVGPNGVLEKDVVLAIARKLDALIRKAPGMRAVMARSGDQFVDLRKRAEIAHNARADLFVSLHADAYESEDAHGSSVFTLSETDASSEAARCLADRENMTEVGGVNLRRHDKVLASVLVDLSKNATLEASDTAAAKVLAALQDDFAVHNPTVQKAGFAVLKSLDVPSVLIETAFISNPQEESRLRDNRHQDQLARSILKGIRAYAAEIRPDLASRLKVADREDR
jgi:N-acetylmuramoyl-L-alanine amidase